MISAKICFEKFKSSFLRPYSQFASFKLSALLIKVSAQTWTNALGRLT